jgi:ketoreductase RED1
VSPEDLDTVVTHSLGIRWATVGPFLGAHLGGGPGGIRHMSTGIGRSMQQLALGQPSHDPEDQERVVQAVEKVYASTPYTDLADARDRGQLAVLSALNDTRHNQHQKEN